MGGSTGVNVAGAIRLAKEMGPGHTIVTLLCDYGTRYQSKLFNPAFLRSKSLPVPKWLVAERRRCRRCSSIRRGEGVVIACHLRYVVMPKLRSSSLFAVWITLVNRSAHQATVPSEGRATCARTFTSLLRRLRGYRRGCDDRVQAAVRMLATGCIELEQLAVGDRPSR